MSTTSKNKTLLMLLGVLLLTNFALLYLLLKPEDKPKELSRNEKMAKWMKESLDFDESQTTQYIKLREYRDSIMQPLNEDLRDAKLTMLQLLKEQSVTDSVIQMAAKQVTEKQMPIEVEFHNHFRRLKALCKPEQLPAFDSMLVNMVNRNTGNQPKKENSSNK